MSYPADPGPQYPNQQAVPTQYAQQTAHPAPGPPPASRTQRRWWWVTGGAVLASALWAGGLAAAGIFTSDGGDGAYKYTAKACAALAEQPFTSAGFTRSDKAGKNPDGSTSNPYADGQQLEAIDTMVCTVRYTLPSGGSSAASVGLVVRLHKKTDPRPNFESQVAAQKKEGSGQIKTEVQSVPDLGESAYFITRTRKGMSGASVMMQGYDGWTEFQLSWNESALGSGTPTPGSQVKSMLTESMKKTLDNLRK